MSAPRAESDRRFLCFAGYTLDLRGARLHYGAREIALRPKCFSLLRYLVENAGRVVAKEDLAAAIWPEAMVTDESVARSVSDVRLAIGDREQRLIKTVARRGYRFEAAVTSLPEVPPLTLSDVDIVVRPRLSLVVLPFANLGLSATFDYFVDALSESLATDLSYVPDTLVIPCRPASAYQGKIGDARQIGLELGVLYVVAGSVLTSGERLRVGAHLIDAGLGAILWADRFDTPLADPLDMEGEITARLARGIRIALLTIESRRAKRTPANALDSVDLMMRGAAIINRPLSAASVGRARGCFEAALRLDDRNLNALIGLAFTHFHDVSNWLAPRPGDQKLAAEAAISKAVALAPGAAAVHYVRACVWQIARSPELALLGFEHVLELDRRHFAAHGSVGLMKVYLGRAQETGARVSEAIRLNPRDPTVSSWHFVAGVAEFFLGKVDSARDRFRKSLEFNPHSELTHFYLAATLAELGLRKDAAAACHQARSAMPHFSIAKYVAEAFSNNPVFLAQRERVIEAMRKAGVPEATPFDD